MSSDLERLSRMKSRQAKLLEAESQQAARRRATDMKIRQAEKAVATRRAMLIGETIRDEKLTPHERAVICGVISRRKEKPADWDKISDFHLSVVHEPHEVVAAKPVITEFARAGK